MPYFIPRPQPQEAFQWEGDMAALHAWIDPKVVDGQANWGLDANFAIDTDPATGNLRFTQWGYFFYARVGDWVTWQVSSGVGTLPNGVDNNPLGLEPADGPVPAAVAGDFPYAEPVPEPEQQPAAADPAASTDVQPAPPA